VSERCKKVYVPRVGEVAGICPDGYTSGSCVVVQTCILPGTEQAGLNDVLDELHRLLSVQSRVIDVMGKQIAAMEQNIREIRIDIDDLNRKRNE
jgi:hypothetical protein